MEYKIREGVVSGTLSGVTYFLPFGFAFVALAAVFFAAFGAAFEALAFVAIFLSFRPHL